MTSNRKTAIVVGVLFIIGTVAGILSAVITGPILTSVTYLVDIAANQSQIVIGALFVLIMGFALAMIPAMMFPIFRKYDEALALGAVIFRGVLETVAYIAIAICWLILITVSREYVAGTPEASSQIMGALLQDAGHWIAQLLAIVFSMGALMIYYLFYTSKLIPRWLSAWGLIGGILYLAAPLLTLFGLSLNQEILMMPLALQEMVLAVWLIVKGFNQSEVAPATA